MATKRYGRKQAERLLARVMAIDTLSLAQARRVLSDLLGAQFGDVVAVGARLETLHTLRHEATDDEISMWRQQLHERLLEDVGSQRRVAHIAGGHIVQRVKSSETLIMPSERGITIEIDGTLTDLLALQMYVLTRVVGLKRARTCECGRWFLKLGRREFCTARCQKRYYMRRYRSGEAGKE